jgi:adhesin/invasin
MKSAIFPKIVKRSSLIVMVTLPGLVAAVLLMVSAGPTLALADPSEPAFGTGAVGNVIGSGAVGMDSQNVTGAPPAALAAGTRTTITLELNPTKMIANSNQTSIITATVVDSNTNPVQGVPLTGTLSSSSLGTFPGFGYTDLNGHVSGTWTAGPGTVAGSGTLTVTDGTSTATAAITLTAETPTTIVLTALPTSLQVGTYSRLKATVNNQFGYPVSDGTSVTFHTNRGYFTFDTVDTQYGLAWTDTSSRSAGVATITATSGPAVSNQVAVTFTAGDPTQLTLTASPASQVVGANSVLTAIISDSFGNRVGSGITVTFATDRDTVSPNPATTTSNGIATSNISSTLVGTAHVTAKAGTATGSTSVTFTPGTGYTVTLQVPTTAQVVGTTSLLTATVTDQFGNPVADGTFVTITKDSGVFVNSPLQTMSGSANSVFSSTIAATRRITAESGLDRDTRSVTFVPDVPFSLTLMARPVSQTVGLSSILTATVADRFNNRVTSGRSVTFTKDLAGTIVPQVSTTNANGIATSRVTITVASLAHITATGETPTAWNSTVITFTPGTAVSLTVELGEYNLIAGSSATSTITVTVQDKFGNPIQESVAEFPITSSHAGSRPDPRCATSPRPDPHRWG